MATKVFQSKIWAARDNNNEVNLYTDKPIYNEQFGVYQDTKYDKDDPTQKIINTIFCKKYLPKEIEQILNLTTIDKPYEIELEITFTDLPDVDRVGLPYRTEMLQKAADAVREYTDCLLITKHELSELKARIRNLEQIKEAYFVLKSELKLALKDIEIK